MTILIAGGGIGGLTLIVIAWIGLGWVARAWLRSREKGEEA